MKKHFMSILLTLCVFSVTSQVTIGLDESPMKGALLDFKEKSTEQVVNDLETSTKGVLFPRVYLVHPNQLEPLVENPSESDKKLATGMLVFNITVEERLNFNYGLYMWNGTEWIMVSDARSDAKFDDLTVNDISVNGEYVKNHILEQSNNLTINFNVTKKGKYTIFAAPEPSNGYYFRSSGEFNAIGSQEITIQGFGTPSFSTNDKNGEMDNIVIEANSSPKVNILNYIKHPGANYEVDCNSIEVSGTYYPDQIWQPDNYIKINITTPNGYEGETYNISTNKTNGYSFHGQGTTTGGTETVYLYPVTDDFPINEGTDNFTIITNSSTDEPLTRCSFSINIMERQILHIQGLGDHLYHLLGNEAKFAKSAIANNDNFGANGIYNKIKGFKWDFTNSSNDAYFKSYLNNPDIDIVVASYITNINSCSSEAINLINSGRVLVFCTESNTLNNMNGTVNVIKGIFDGITDADIAYEEEYANAYVSYIQDPNDPILNGPFGCVYDINGTTPRFKALYGNNSGFKVNHPDFVPIVLQANGFARVFYHKQKGFIFFGDGSALKHLMMDFENSDTAQQRADKTAMQRFLLNMLTWAAEIRLNP